MNRNLIAAALAVIGLLLALWMPLAVHADEDNPHGDLGGLECAACHTTEGWRPLLDVLGYGVELLVQRRKVEISRKLTDFGEFCKHEQRVIRDTCGLIHFVAIWVYI